jgi:hypothetical protein
MTTTLRVPRSRGALSGLLLVLLGLWGALMPLIGPYFHFGFTPDKAWHFTSGRVWLQIVPGLAVFLGGLIALGSANRAFAAFGAWLAALGGAWFVIGVPLSAEWADQGHTQLGRALGGTTRQVSEQLTLLYGLGVVAVFLAAVALGRLAVVGVKDARLAERQTERQAERDAAERDGDRDAAGRDAERADDDVANADTEENPRLEPSRGPRPPLVRRKARREQAAVPPPRGPYPAERVPATPTEAPATTSPSDVKVAGEPGTEETDRPRG